MGSPRLRFRPWAPFLAAAALAAAVRAGTPAADPAEQGGGLARALSRAARDSSLSSSADRREALAETLRRGERAAALEAARDLLAAPAASPRERMENLLFASPAVVPAAPRAEALGLFREYVSAARAHPGAAPRPPAAFFGALAPGLLRDAAGPPFGRAARAAALADALCADLPPSERVETAAALRAAAACVPRGTPGIEGLALGWLERALELDPSNLAPVTHWILLALPGTIPESGRETLFAAVDSIPPPAPVFRYAVPAWEAACLVEDGDPAGATNLLSRARGAWDSLRPGSPPPPGWFAALSAARDGAGDAAGAREALERGLAEAGRDPTLLNNFAYLLAERGEELDLALDLADEALAARPLEPAYLDTLGWILHKRGQFEDAIEAYHKALPLMDGPDPEIAAHVALAFEALGRTEEAAAWWASVPVRNAAGPPTDPE